MLAATIGPAWAGAQTPTVVSPGGHAHGYGPDRLHGHVPLPRADGDERADPRGMGAAQRRRRHDAAAVAVPAGDFFNEALTERHGARTRRPASGRGHDPAPAGTWSYAVPADAELRRACPASSIQDPDEPDVQPGRERSTDGHVRTAVQPGLRPAGPGVQPGRRRPPAAGAGCGRASRGRLEVLRYASPGGDHVRDPRALRQPGGSARPRRSTRRPAMTANRAVPYPTLYLSHGGQGNEIDWATQGAANQIIDNLIRERASCSPSSWSSTDFNGLPTRQRLGRGGVRPRPASTT